MKPSVQHSACVRIINRLIDVGPDIYQSTSALPITINEVVRKYTPATGRQITGILNSEEGFDTYSSHAFVYGPIVEEGTPKLWPVMTFSGGQGCDNLRVRVALFFDNLEAGSVSVEEGAEIARAVAWRFEPPEGPKGAHCYYHAQPISSWDKTIVGKLPVHQPVNESQPGFPLKAEDPVSLLAAALVSIYGHAYTKEEIFGDLHFRRDIRPARTSFSYLKLLE
jgi:hypothetical protein